MFNDDGLGQAMALAGARDTADAAKKKAEALEQRVADLERQVGQLQLLVEQLNYRTANSILVGGQL